MESQLKSGYKKTHSKILLLLCSLNKNEYKRDLLNNFLN